MITSYGSYGNYNEEEKKDIDWISEKLHEEYGLGKKGKKQLEDLDET